MKNSINKKLRYILPTALLLLAACAKNDNKPTVITNNYNLSLPAATQTTDYLSIDVDNDNVPDFRVFSKTNAFINAEITKDAYIASVQDSTLIALTKSFANYGWFRLYTFDSLSIYYSYAAGFGTGAVIGAGIPNFTTATKSSTSTTAFERVGITADYLGSTISPSTSFPQYTYNESEGSFSGATKYVGFSMLKADGRHYGWIKIAVSNSNLSVQVISSGYSTIAGQSITIN